MSGEILCLFGQCILLNVICVCFFHRTKEICSNLMFYCPVLLSCSTLMFYSLCAFHMNSTCMFHTVYVVCARCGQLLIILFYFLVVMKGLGLQVVRSTQHLCHKILIQSPFLFLGWGGDGLLVTVCLRQLLHTNNNNTLFLNTFSVSALLERFLKIMNFQPFHIQYHGKILKFILVCSFLVE